MEKALIKIQGMPFVCNQRNVEHWTNSNDYWGLLHSTAPIPMPLFHWGGEDKENIG